MKDTTSLADDNLFKQAVTPDDALVTLLTIIDKGREFLASMAGNFVVSDNLKSANMGEMMGGFQLTQQMLTDWLALPEVSQ